MRILYNWLSDYLPEKIEPLKLSKILTSIGLEVESLEKYESIKGGLQGLVAGEVLTCEPHPDADKLKVTTVNVGKAKALQIVCGAPNVAAGQKVIVAVAGATIYTTAGDELIMKEVKISGVESEGMICAEDEIGTGTNHEGIIILPANVTAGTAASDIYKPYQDWIFEIGLTPNRIDAMSHFGVARDVCAYLTHHNNKETKPKSPFVNTFKPDNQHLLIKVIIENQDACRRYSGISISNVTVKDSPRWLKERLTAVGLRPMNNIVDITNYVLWEAGQPLHAFDADEIKGKQVVVKNLTAGSVFITLDGKERKPDSDDLMICNAEEGMCIAGVFGGIKSGVKETTKNIFLESAWFNPVNVRKTSVRHGLRTDAAARFEKGVDISNTVNVLKRAALLIKEIAGGEISSNVIDVYPKPKEKTEVGLKYHYLKKLSGKNYHPDAIKRILLSLGFEIIKEGMDELWVAVPFSKPDISLQADIVEEILRIDGLDNIEIPAALNISPASETLGCKDQLKEKIGSYLAAQGFNEIMTNSITNSKYFSDEVLKQSVRMINNLSADLDVLRPAMLETGLEAIAYNNNRKNSNLKFFEFGNTYHSKSIGKYTEDEHICLYITGANNEDSWRTKSKPMDLFYAKGIATSIFALNGLGKIDFVKEDTSAGVTLNMLTGKIPLGAVHEVTTEKLKQFDIKQPVFFIDIHFAVLLKLVEKHKIFYEEVAKFPSVQRDVAMIVDKNVTYAEVEALVRKEKLPKLINMRLFDVFENEKIGAGKKSIAVNFTFLDEEKTLTDKETDSMVKKLIQRFEKELSAEIRK